MEMFYITPPGPLDCNLFSSSTLNSATPAFSYPTTAEASLEEARSLLAPASVSPKLVHSRKLGCWNVGVCKMFIVC
ncbi:hypothetical protein ACB094_12G023300 [Castanea mollissima]